ncbi:MAG: phosphatase PAP2 family protein [Dysgonamonadaceae bacterium]|jgi:undecaprenyl-diphosphatase|nr:phosphatase PAP2 family protein [Dysgonamonadaceae bacterium]
MLEQELQWEKDIFFFLNGSNSTLLDNFFWGYSWKWTWIPFYLCFFFVFVYKNDRKETLLIILSVTILVFLCDQIASGFCKPFFHRFRPSHHPDFQEQVKIVFGYKGGKYGFISSHAANAFGFAVFTARLFKNKFFTGTILLFALINAYSRVYLGVHFISDIIVGAVVGVILGFTVYWLYDLCKRKFLKINIPPKTNPFYPVKTIYFLCAAYFAMLLFLFLYAFVSNY